MKYTYAYKTSDGRRHEATIEAASREAAFAALRAQGIKPIKVAAADGSKANGEVVVRGVRRRVVMSVAIAAALLAGVVVFGLSRGGILPPHQKNQSSSVPLFSTPILSPTAPRHQIYGDPVIMGEIEHGKTEAWLSQRGDRILAWFAQPGKLACPKGTDLRRAVFEFEKETSDMCRMKVRPSSDTCRQPLPISPDEPREVRELKQIVNGLKEEMSAYLANGNGTLRSYWRRLMARTREEMQIYERTRRELEKETDPKVWDEKNESLRILGIRTIPNPKEAE